MHLEDVLVAATPSREGGGGSSSSCTMRLAMRFAGTNIFDHAVLRRSSTSTSVHDHDHDHDDDYVS
jgi:hypothetical protein